MRIQRMLSNAVVQRWLNLDLLKNLRKHRFKLIVNNNEKIRQRTVTPADDTDFETIISLKAKKCQKFQRQLKFLIV